MFILLSAASACGSLSECIVAGEPGQLERFRSSDETTRAAALRDLGGAALALDPDVRRAAAAFLTAAGIVEPSTAGRLEDHGPILKAVKKARTGDFSHNEIDLNLCRISSFPSPSEMVATCVMHTCAGACMAHYLEVDFIGTSSGWAQSETRNHGGDDGSCGCCQMME